MAGTHQQERQGKLHGESLSTTSEYSQNLGQDALQKGGVQEHPLNTHAICEATVMARAGVSTIAY
jgi:hypothetical protein